MSNLTGAAAFAETAQIASTVHRVHARLASWLRAATAFFDTPLGLDVECARALLLMQGVIGFCVLGVVPRWRARVAVIAVTLSRCLLVLTGRLGLLVL